MMNSTTVSAPIYPQKTRDDFTEDVACPTIHFSSSPELKSKTIKTYDKFLSNLDQMPAFRPTLDLHRPRDCLLEAQEQIRIIRLGNTLSNIPKKLTHQLHPILQFIYRELIREISLLDKTFPKEISSQVKLEEEQKKLKPFLTRCFIIIKEDLEGLVSETIASRNWEPKILMDLIYLEKALIDLKTTLSHSNLNS